MRVSDHILCEFRAQQAPALPGFELQQRSLPGCGQLRTQGLEHGTSLASRLLPVQRRALRLLYAAAQAPGSPHARNAHLGVKALMWVFSEYSLLPGGPLSRGLCQPGL